MAPTTSSAAVAATAAAASSLFHPKPSFPSRFLSPIPRPLFPKLPLPVSQIPLSIHANTNPSVSSPTTVRHFGPDEPCKGCDVLVEALECEGVRHVFAYPGEASMEILQALTRSPTIINHLCRHEQGEVFAAEGFAQSTGLPDVYITTSGPGAINLVSALTDALLDSVPLVAITGQVLRRMIGTDAFQETPIVEVTRSITKYNYLVLDIDDIPRIVHEAFFLATSGRRPGAVLIDNVVKVKKEKERKWSPPEHRIMFL